MVDYNDMTVEELKKLKFEMNQKRDETTAELRSVALALDIKLAEKAASEKVARMSDTEKKALSQAIQAEGIKSEEAVGNSGVG